MSLPANPQTIRSLATQLKISAMTVSRALRNAVGVSAATRQRVLAAAEKHGYRPDPSLAVLNAYRRSKRHLLPTETIAYLSNFPKDDEWRRVSTFNRYFSGVQTRAAELGYKLEDFWLSGPELTDRRASQILSSRGIRGLIIGPLHRETPSLDLDWSQFATVALGRSLVSPAITAVSTHHAQAVELAWQEARARGYRRIGLVLTEDEEKRTAGMLHAAHLIQQSRHAACASSTLITPDFSGPALVGWARSFQPDLVMASHPRHHELLAEGLGPDIRGVKFLNLDANPLSEISGVDQGHELVGAAAVTLLHHKLVHREVGIAQRRELTLIDGIWQEGRGEEQLTQRHGAPASKPDPRT